MIGKTVSHYRIEEKLGEGGMGVVFRAEDSLLRRSVALKFLPPHLVADSQARDRFVREAQAASALDHPNVCVIHEIGETGEGELFIAMAYYPGMTLAQKLERGPLPIPEAIEVTRQVARGLSKAHSLGIVHRDIKPANLNLTEDGIWKILDFGIAKLAGSTRATRTGAALGTVAYMSPEQAEADEVAAPSDIWSLGVVLYEMLTGRLPFRGATPVAVLYQILHEEPDPIGKIREEVPVNLERIIARALAKDVKARYGSMSELLVDVEMLGEMPGQVDHPSGPKVESQALPEGMAVTPPPFLVSDSESSSGMLLPPFVGRRAEMAVLERWLQEARSGRGRVGFIAGEAGTGKTALAQEFFGRAGEADPNLIVASGTCNAHIGVGDPHRPFREILGQLSGDVEAQWAAGSVTAEHATRLWSLLPRITEAFVEGGADLLGTFVSETALLARAEGHPAVTRSRLADLRTIERRQAKGGSIQQADLFEQYVWVLRALAKDKLLLLVVDDLQWADTGSIGLLFELGHHLAGSKILVLGLYRTTEVALGRDGGRHPFEPVVNELAGIFGDVVVEFDSDADRDFVDALIDAEPNRLEAGFRDSLLAHTAGHALFTVELLRALKDQGLLHRDESEKWVVGEGRIDWNSLPARVDALIGERIGRLTPELQRLLTVASVEGERFTLEALAAVAGIEARELIAPLSLELEKRHHLVVAEGLERLNGQRLSIYRFRHILFQRHLYERLDDVERPDLHEQVGEALERLYGDGAKRIALSLAHQFQEARLPAKASEYFSAAGDEAQLSLAPVEALAHYESALDALLTLPPSEDRDPRELALQLAIAQTRLGLVVPGFAEAYTRALELAKRVGTPEQLFWASVGSYWVAYYGGDWGRTEEHAQICLSVAREAGDTGSLLMALLLAGLEAKQRGERRFAEHCYEEVIGLPDSDQYSSPIWWSDAGAFARSTLGLIKWECGYPEQATALFGEAVSRARKTGDPSTLQIVLFRDILIRMWGGDIRAAKARCDESLASMTEVNRTGTGPITIISGGWCDVLLGEVDAGIEAIERGVRLWEAAGMFVFTGSMWALLARALAMAGRAEEGLQFLKEAMAQPFKNEPANSAEVHRHLGELYLALRPPDEVAAEAAFRSGIDIAHEQEVPSWELLATMSLARLLQRQGRVAEARRMLGEIYGWFTEGHDWPYMVEARELLEALEGSA